MPSRRIRRPALLAIAIVSLAACSESDPGYPPAISPLQSLAADITVEPASIALGDTAWVTVTLHNDMPSTAVTVAKTDGCPVFEPVATSAGGHGPRPFVPTCFSSRGRDQIDPARATLTVNARDSVQVRFPFTGTVIDVVGNTRCNIVGRYEISGLETRTYDAIFLVRRHSRAAATGVGEVRAPAGTPTC